MMTDTSRTCSVPETTSQHKAERQSLLWKESGERRGNADVTFSFLLLKRWKTGVPLCFTLMQILPLSLIVDRKLIFV